MPIKLFPTRTDAIEANLKAALDAVENRRAAVSDGDMRKAEEWSRAAEAFASTAAQFARGTNDDLVGDPSL